MRRDLTRSRAAGAKRGGGGVSLYEPLFLVDDDMEVDMTIC